MVDLTKAPLFSRTVFTGYSKVILLRGEASETGRRTKFG